MKIKQKKQLNLPQLIEWIEKNGIRNHVFISDIDRNEVEINIHGCIFCKHITLNDTFTVEVEEEIDEFSDIKRLAHYTVHGFTSTNFNKSIGELRKSNSLAFYIMNDDRTLTLIWTKEKGMVE
ncbi:hypothetical protein [Staphylococcus equorum]|uniref:hypothetical protein n=1 Tax=Staphylococcus equorum TaxID=246432 RepID=UPI000853DD34|nr:hypothetical protein [Staphylococcus equorum]OEK62806.1 hypothetical protein ASS99_07810 [Staphylococcus equorum]